MQTLTSVLSPVVMRWQIAPILSAVLSANVVTGLLVTARTVKVNNYHDIVCKCNITPCVVVVHCHIQKVIIDFITSWATLYILVLVR